MCCYCRCGTSASRIKRLPEPRREPSSGPVITGRDDIEVAPTGVYFYKLQTKSEIRTRKMLRLN